MIETKLTSSIVLYPRDRRSRDKLFLSCLSKSITLFITFGLWLLERMTRPFRGHLLTDLDLGVLLTFKKKLSLLITFQQWVLELWYLIWTFLEIRSKDILFCSCNIFVLPLKLAIIGCIWVSQTQLVLIICFVGYILNIFC